MQDVLQWVAPVNSFSYVYKTPEFDFEQDFSFYAVELADEDAEAAVLFNRWSWAEKREAPEREFASVTEVACTSNKWGQP